MWSCDLKRHRMWKHVAAAPKPVQIRAKIVIPSLKRAPKNLKPNLWNEFEIMDYLLLNRLEPKLKRTWRDKVGYPLQKLLMPTSYSMNKMLLVYSDLLPIDLKLIKILWRPFGAFVFGCRMKNTFRTTSMWRDSRWMATSRHQPKTCSFPRHPRPTNWNDRLSDPILPAWPWYDGKTTYVDLADHWGDQNQLPRRLGWTSQNPGVWAAGNGKPAETYGSQGWKSWWEESDERGVCKSTIR